MAARAQAGDDRERPRVVWAPQAGPQTALLSCPVAEVFYGGARGGGKTDGLIGDWLAHAAAYGKHARGIFFRRTYDELAEVQERMQEIMPRLGWLYIEKSKYGSKSWRHKSMARLRMRYLERDAHAANYQGHSYTWLGCDEIGNFPDLGPILKLKGTLRSPHGVPCVMRTAGNPGGPGHAPIKERYIDPAPGGWKLIHDQETGENRIFIPSRITDNKLLMANDPGYINRLKGAGPPWLVQAWLEGDFNAAPEGGIIKSAWFQRYREPPTEFLQIVQSWDTASKKKKENAYSVCTTWGITRFGYYLLHVMRERLNFPELQKKARAMADQWCPNVILIEDMSSGQALIQDLQANTSLPVRAIQPEGDKITRISATSQYFESGKMFLPESAPWRVDYELELTIYPQAAFADQVDSTSQFLNYIRSSGGGPFNFISVGGAGGRRST